MFVDRRGGVEALIRGGRDFSIWILDRAALTIVEFIYRRIVE